MKIAELLQSLSDSQVQYVLVGGLAVQLHGFLRATFDIDLVLAMNDENLVRFIDVAKSFGLTPGIPVPIESLRNAEQIDQWHREKGMLAFSLREPQTGGGVVGVLVRPEVTFEKLFANATEGSLFGRRVPIASIEDLLAMKRIANRPKDRLDIEALEKIQRGEDPNETTPRQHTLIPETLMHARLAQSEQMREFFIEMWLQNPAMARQAGGRVRAMLSPLVAVSPAPTFSGAVNQKTHAMTKPPPLLSRLQSGFTIIELITLVLIMGVMAVVALPRLDLLRGFDEVGYRDKVKATLEYARKSAVAQRRSVRVTLAGNNLTLDIETCHPEGTLTSTPPCAAPIALGSFPRALALPVPDRACGGATNQICAPTGVTLAGPATLSFTPLGVPSAAGTYTVTGDAAQTITVEAESGYVR